MRQALSINKGFTLLELLVVVSIIFMTVALALPVYTKSLNIRKLEKCTNQLAQDLRWVEQISLNDTEDTPRYQLKINSSNYSIADSKKNITLKKINCDSVQISSSSSSFVFSSDLTKNTALKITLTASGQKKYIFVAPVTGRVRISDSNTKQSGE